MAKNKNESITPTAQKGELGLLLVETREKVGYSIAQVADAMCLSEETITRLENEEFSLLAEPPYIRGYLRNYAKLADTDADELIQCYESLRGADPGALNYHFKTSAKFHSDNNKRKLSPIFLQLFFLALLVAILAGISMIPAVNKWVTSTWNSFSNQTASQSTTAGNPLLTGTMPVPSPLSVQPNTETSSESKTTDSQAKEQMKPDPVASTKIETNSPKVIKKEPETTTKNETIKNIIVDTDSKTPKEEARIPTSTNGTINVKLVFNKEVWMRIRDENKKTVFEGQNPSGEEKLLTLKKPLTFRVGNAQGLTLFVDGQKVDISSYIKGSVANFTLE